MHRRRLVPLDGGLVIFVRLLGSKGIVVVGGSNGLLGIYVDKLRLADVDAFEVVVAEVHRGREVVEWDLRSREVVECTVCFGRAWC